MKIVHLRDKYLGVTFIHFLLQGFCKHEHYVLCREADRTDLIKFPFNNILKTSIIFYPLWFIDKFCQVYLKFNYRRINDWISYYLKIKSISNVSIIHAHMGPQGVYALPLAKKLNIPLLTTFYGADMSEYVNSKYWIEKYRKLFNESAGIIVEGAYMKKKMIELGCPSEKVFINRIGIPLDLIKFNYRPSYNQENGCLKIFMCATFTHKKGFFDALSLFRLLLNKNINFHVYIVGDGILKNDIENKIIEYNLLNNIDLLGRRGLEDIYSIANNCHIFFHPSKFGPTGDSEGGAPTIILEMQALGLPVISTYHADIPNIIPSDNHILLSNEGDVDNLYNCFEYFISNYKDWNSISDRGRSFVNMNHYNKECAKLLEEYYEFIYNNKN